jgi:hypothetical protein
MTIDPYDNTTWPPFSDERGDGRDPYGVHKKYCAAAPSVGSFSVAVLYLARVLCYYMSELECYYWLRLSIWYS